MIAHAGVVVKWEISSIVEDDAGSTFDEIGPPYKL
jgi:hypothetical protein